MKNFFVKSLLFAIPILVIIGLFEYELSLLPNSYDTKRKYFEKQLGSIEILVLGSSQSLFGINPSYFSHSGFNLSNVSQSVYYDTRLTLHYLNKMPKLKCVLIPISYFTFGFQLNDSPESWRDAFYSTFWGIYDRHIKWYDIKLYSKFFLYTPRTSLEYAIKLFKVRHPEELSQNGWMKNNAENDNLRVSDTLGKERVNYHDILIKDSHYIENYADLGSLINKLNERGVKVIIITMPVFETYYKYVNPKINEKNELVIKNLCNKYECTYYDYFRDKRFTKEDFADNDHLNYLGAEKFSRIINSEIINKYFKNKQS